MKKTIVIYLIAPLWLCTIHAQDNILKTAPEATTIETTLEFKDIPDLKEAFINATPKDRKDGIVVGKLGIDGGDKPMILKLAQDISNNKYGNFDSFLIAHKGKLLFESYYSRGRVDLPHPQASATKAYTTLGLGRAIQLGYLNMNDLNKPLVSFLKKLDPTKFVEGAEKITLHQALTMRSGIRLSEKQREEIDQNSSMVKGQGLVQAYFENSTPITSESQSFKYQFDPMLVMQVLDAVVPGTAKDFIKNELLDKMGISNYHWRTDINGLPRSGNGTSMTSRDMMKWGILTMNKGKWNGEQLVPATFIDKAINRIVQDNNDENFADYDNITNIGYGYYWWQADMKCGNKSYFSTSAQGGSGQNIILIEELDLIVVTTTHRKVDDAISVTATKVLPAFTKDKLLSPEDLYFGQKPPGLIPKLFDPKIVSPEGRFDHGSFTPDMKEFYFTRKNGKYKKRSFFVIRYENNRWGQESETDIKWPQFSTDGNVMYIGKTYRERTDTGWSEPKSPGDFIKDMAHGISVSAKGTYYITVYKKGDSSENGAIHYSRLIDGKYENPVKINVGINSAKYVGGSTIAPDESYLIWYMDREDGYGDTDMYISFKQEDGSWLPAINMGSKINTEMPEGAPQLTHDGKYLFFTRGEWKVKEDGSRYYVGKRYWVDAKVIETLKPKR